jgi:hypothetical protein
MAGNQSGHDSATVQLCSWWLCIETLNAILRAVAETKGIAKEDVLNPS